MTITIKIPPSLRTLTEGNERVQVESENVEQALGRLGDRYKDVKSKVFDDDDNVRRFVNVYVNDTDIRALEGLKSATKQGDVLTIFLAIAGG